MKKVRGNIFSKHILEKLGSPPSKWANEADGQEVKVIDKHNGKVGHYGIEPKWCKEIKPNNEFLGKITAKETGDATVNLVINGIAYKNSICNIREFKFYRNGNAITCILKSGSIKVIGISRCNPEDTFNYSYGMQLAEYRARANFYKELEKNI